MDREQYAIMYEVERRHWWYRGMRRNARALLARYLAPGRPYQLLDAGCGTGGTTIELAEIAIMTGIDMSEDALAYACARGLHRLVQGSIEHLPFPDATFDVWTCFDVLYHRAVGAEAAALAEAHRVLKPGGIALCREPAFDWLRGAHDVGIHTARRFTVGRLAQRLREAGFTVEVATYGNMVLFPLALAKRAVDRFLPAIPTDLSVPPAPVNCAFESILMLEGALSRRTPLPFGLSAIALGRA